MPKTLISDQIKNVYQKIVFFLTSDNKLYKTAEDGSNDDTVVTTVANDLTWTGTQTYNSNVTLNGGMAGTSVKDEDDMSSNSATALATQQSIKAYADTKIPTANILDEDDMSSNSAIKVPSQQSTKAYVDATIPSVLGSSPTITTPNISTPAVSLNLNLERNSNIVFEGGTINDHETTLTVTDPTADRTVTLADETYTIYPSKDEDDMTSNSATHTATQQSIKAYVDNAGGQASSVVLAGSENGIAITGENNKWALVHMCTTDQNHRLLVHISFSSTGSSSSIISSNGLSLNGHVGLNAYYIGMSAGDKLQMSKVCGDSAVTFTAAVLSP